MKQKKSVFGKSIALSDLSIITKSLIAPLIASVAIICVAGVFALSNAESTREQGIADAAQQKLLLIKDLQNTIGFANADLLEMVSIKEAGGQDDLVASRYDDLQKRLVDGTDRLDRLHDGLDADHLPQMDEIAADYASYALQAKDVYDSLGVDVFLALMKVGTTQETADQLASRTKALSDKMEQAANLARAAANDAQKTALAAVIATAALALIVSMAAAFLLGRAVSGPIRKITSIMENLAAGNLDVEVPFAARRDEVGKMAETLKTFRANGLAMRDAETEKQQTLEKEHAENDLRNRLQEEVARVVSAAVAGDFSKRIEGGYGREDFDALANSVNALIETVDRGLGETGDVLSALAETDLTRRVEGSYQGAFDKLKTDTNALGDKLVEIVAQLKQTSRGVKTATGEILSGANDLSERTTKQAATIEETSAAMEQLAHTVMDNAKRAGEASAQANKASHTAEEGGKVMAEANQAMERISTSASKISNIIGMIDDIAFQTNLLALNASVEAARAGEAGKGFAVVAVEVRRLAQSAAQASSEVKVLIEQSGVEVSGGTKLVANAAEKLAAILEAVKTNAGQMEEIAKDSREQASAIEEVNVAVRQMDEMTQHNAALVEQTNAAIEQTEAQASELDRIVAVFTLADAGARGARPGPQTRPATEPRSGIRGLQDKVASAAKTYLSKGNTAVKAKQDWSEF